MNINPISFQKIYKINATQNELHKINKYLEKNNSRNSQGFKATNSDFRIFDDIQKDIPNFRYIDNNGNLYILSGKEAKSAWNILIKMMDSIKEAQKSFGEINQVNETIESFSKIANSEINKLIQEAQIQTLNIQWKNRTPIFSIVG